MKQTEPNHTRLRMMIAFFGYSQRGAAMQLGVSTTLLRALLDGTSHPDKLTKERIEVMSRRWPYGAILSKEWPGASPDRRTKAEKEPKKKPSAKVSAAVDK